MLANSGDPDQTQRSAASDLGLQCLSVSPKKDYRLIWVKNTFFYGRPYVPLSYEIFYVTFVL